MTQLSPTTHVAETPAHIAGNVPSGSGLTTPSLRSDLMVLTKVRITLMVAITAWVGYALGVAALGTGWDWFRLLGAMAGTSLSCMGAAVLNQAYEHDTDAMMHRTRARPIPAGRVSVAAATWLGMGLSVVGVAMLWVTTHWLAAALSAATIFSYVLIYTPMKRTSSLALLVGAAPGAAPPLIGYAAVTGTLDAAAWIAFAIMFVWQVPHFLAIAWLYREDYARGGMPMLPVIDPDGRRTFRQVLIGCLLLLPLGVAPAYLGVTGPIYMFIALILGMGFLGLGIRLTFQPTRASARLLFFGSLIYLPAVFAAMVADLA